MTETFIGEVLIRSSEPVLVIATDEAEGQAAGDEAGPLPGFPGGHLPTLAGPVTIKLDGDGSGIMIGGNPSAGSSATIHLNGKAGDITVRDRNGNEVFQFSSRFAILDIGGAGNEGDIRVRNSAGEQTIHLDGNSGDIRLLGADCAEQFDIGEYDPVQPGSVLVIDENGTLGPCVRAYDKRVAGIVSGANGFHPGLILDSRPANNQRAPIALSGKVYCHVDAQYGAIEVGDLLTTSSTKGMAMKAADPMQAFGAVVGKALQPLDSGTGLIPVLVALQ